MSERINYRDLEWTPDPEGEYNAQVTEYRGHRVEIFSDRDETKWEYMVDDEIQHEHADDEDVIKRKAIREVNLWEDDPRKK